MTIFQHVKQYNQVHSDSIFNIHQLYLEKFGVEFDVVYQYNVHDNDDIAAFFTNFETNILENGKFDIKKSITHRVSKTTSKATTHRIDDSDVYEIFEILDDYAGAHHHCNEYYYILSDCIIYMQTDERTWASLGFYYAKETAFVKSVMARVEAQFPLKSKKNKSEFNIICRDKRGFNLKTIKLSTSDDTNFFDYYNDDLKEISNEVVDKLNNTSKGIVLLHGAAGTGKTTYLRYLIRNINKKVIYLPPDLSDVISQPDFITFLMDHKDAVLVIEDAENVLKEREAGGKQAVSNILNITDGILGDALRFQIVTTFNTDIKFIDKALTRPGRLIAEYKFDALSVEQTNRLIKQIYGNDINITDKEMTLAEIFNFNKKKYLKSNIKKQKMGFT